MRNRPVRVGVVALSLAAYLGVPADAEERRQHGAHVHGHATLNVALEGETLAAELVSPAFNIVGFEHVPETDAEKADIAQALERLADAGRMFTIPPDAGCTIVEAHAEHEMESGGHSAFHAHYAWRCTTPSALQTLGVRVFENFPRTEEIDAVVLRPSGQSAQELAADAAELRF